MRMKKDTHPDYSDYTARNTYGVNWETFAKRGRRIGWKEAYDYYRSKRAAGVSKLAKGISNARHLG